MSRVTIEGLYSDFTVPRTEARQWGMNYEQYERLANTEIVPRKIVEAIIERCKKNEEALRPHYGEPFEDGQDVAYTDIRICAEQLLEQFEGDDK